MATRRKKKRKTRKRSGVKPWLIVIVVSLLGMGLLAGLVNHRRHAISKGAHIDGIDVSHYQTEIRWQKVAERPELLFAYIKATEGTTLQDAYFADNVWQAREAGLHVGAYMLYTSEADPDEQFAHFRDYVKGAAYDLIPCIDVEENVSRKNLRERVMRIVELMEAHFGCKPLLYVNAHVYDDFLYPDAAGCELWVPNYSRKPRLKSGQRPIIWQYTDRGEVDGIKGNVDLDCFLNGMTVERLLLKRGR